MGIGIVGAGEIVESCHLPAYKMAGFKVVGIFDLNQERSAKLASDFGIGKVYGSYEELLADSEVLIIDLAVPARYSRSWWSRQRGPASIFSVRSRWLKATKKQRGLQRYAAQLALRPLSTSRCAGPLVSRRAIPLFSAAGSAICFRLQSASM